MNIKAFMVINGLKTKLRPIELNDSKFVCELRNDNNNNKFLSSTRQISIEDQINWLNNFYHNTNDFYFIIENKKHENKGTISLYNIRNNTAEFGRYICNSTQQAIEAEYLLLKFAFEVLNLNTVYCKTLVDNEKIWKQHYKYGFKSISEEYDSTLKQILIVQEITKNDFINFSYNWIEALLNKIKE
jgi:RimJ/RimL family protein N-acetyltransferase